MKTSRENKKFAAGPKKKKQESGGKLESGSGRWMLTYLDMVTLLFGVFILLYAMSSINKAKVQEVAESLRRAFFGGITFYMQKDSGGITPENTLKYLPGTTKELLKFVKSGLSNFQAELASRQIKIIEEERGVSISLVSDIFFKPGSAEVDIDRSREILQGIAEMLSSPSLSDRKFRIEGHTDNVPPDSEKYPTNWELSALRSVNVLHYLTYFGANEKQFQVSGLSDSIPIASNETEEGRSYNRRVDIVILSDANL